MKSLSPLNVCKDRVVLLCPTVTLSDFFDYLVLSEELFMKLKH